MELWKEDRTGISISEICIKTATGGRGGGRDVGEGQIAGHHLHSRDQGEKKRKKSSEKTNNSQTQKRERFCLLISGKGVFCCCCF